MSNLKPPPAGKLCTISFVNKEGSLISKRAMVSRLAPGKSSFVIMFDGKSTIDHVMESYSKKYGHYWAIINRNNPRKEHIIKKVNWDPHYSQRFSNGIQLQAPL